jgi:hypothetical protein
LISSLTFHDPDEDALTFSPTSSNNAIATPTINNGILTVSPKAVGNTTITITADDKKGGARISTTFNVKVDPSPAASAKNFERDERKYAGDEQCDLNCRPDAEASCR